MSRTPIAPDGVPHFSADPSQPFYFYTDWPSNFDRTHPLYLPSPVPPPQPAFAAVPLRYASGEHWLHCNKGRAAILTLSNFSDNDVDAHVGVDLAAMGFQPGQVVWMDAVTPDDPPKLEGGILTTRVPSWRWRMFTIWPVKADAK